MTHGPRVMLVTWPRTGAPYHVRGQSSTGVPRIPDSGPAARPVSQTRPHSAHLGKAGRAKPRKVRAGSPRLSSDLTAGLTSALTLGQRQVTRLSGQRYPLTAQS